MAQKAIKRLAAKGSRSRPVEVNWEWICLRWDMELHFFSKRESKGLERTKVWVVFQFGVGLSDLCNLRGGCLIRELVVAVVVVVVVCNSEQQQQQQQKRAFLRCRYEYEVRWR